eukprot:1094440-Pleurochrysis_carterae.AAC.1
MPSETPRALKQAALPCAQSLRTACVPPQEPRPLRGCARRAAVQRHHQRLQLLLHRATPGGLSRQLIRGVWRYGVDAENWSCSFC